MDLLFRQAFVDEGGLLTELSLRSKAFWNYPSEFIEKCRPFLTIDAEYIKNWPVIVLERVGHHVQEISGFYSLKLIGDEKRLDNLWLEPKFIGQGYGREAIKDAQEQARSLGWNHFYLASEPKAVGFYQKLGGEVVGVVQSKLDENLKLPHVRFAF